MEFGTIEREIHIDASPEIVFQVVSSPEHLREWWPDEARYEPVPGSGGGVVFGDPEAGGAGGGAGPGLGGGDRLRRPRGRRGDGRLHRGGRAPAAHVLLPLDASGR